MFSLQYLHVPKNPKRPKNPPLPSLALFSIFAMDLLPPPTIALTGSPALRNFLFATAIGGNVRYHNSIKRRLSIVKDMSVKIPIGNSSCVKGGSNCWSFLGGLNGIGLNGCGCNFMVFNGNFVIFRYDFSNSKNFKLASLFLSSCFHLGIMYPGPGLWLLSQVLLLVRDAK